MNKKRYKDFIQNRLLKEQRRVRRRKEKRRKDRISNVKLRQNRKYFSKYAEVIAPEILTLQLGYSEEVLRFIALLKKLGKTEDIINIRLHKVTDIGEGAIGMLLSVMKELTNAGISLRGEKPFNTIAKNKLEMSGFFKYMRGYVSPENLKTKNIIIHTGDITTSQEELAPAMPQAMETVWGVEARCPELFGVIGEMLRNSCDHAFRTDKNVFWHLGISHLEKDNTVKFSFVDNGVGIIHKYYEDNNWQKVKDHFKSNATILENAYKKGIVSQTGLFWRGEGLPTIYELYTDNIITNLVVITNNVYLDFDKKKFKEIKIPFSGTYYFWKVNNSCTPAHYPLL
ncbi:hypothetical protein ACFO3O_04570 [Dokdonia ponticola]|uniref:ATP-binding protein n=1 Tax=Dokdonia ponticola TaxID=2041041 RepID=A0ABV9HV37_9FLAO